MISFLLDHLREVVTVVVVLVLIAVVVLIAWFAFAGHVGPAVAVAFALVTGAGVTCGLVFLAPSLLPFIEQRERVAARSLVGVVGNGSIAFASSPTGNVDIYVVDPEGADIPTRLTNDPAVDTDPAWSPDGESMAFVSSRAGNAEIHVMDADGSDVKRLTEHPGADRQPAWSPDGERIAFTSLRDGNREVYVMDADGSDPISLTTSAGRDGDASWGPDGAHLAFASTRDGDSDLYRYLELEEGNPTVLRVTKNSVEDRWPGWAPDGGQLAFIGTEPDGSRSLNVETEPSGSGGQVRRVTRLQPLDARVSWQPVPRQGLELPEDEDDPVRRHAPLVYIHPAEVRLPMDAAEFARRSHMRCGGTDLGEVEPQKLAVPPLGLPRPGSQAGDDTFASCAEREPLLMLDRGFEFGARSRSAIAGLYTGVPVYYEHVARPRAITYWFFYAYSVTAGAVGRHQGDWEGISLCLGKDGRPTEIVYYQHKESEIRRWAWAPKMGTHPIVYSAKGSHASYPQNLGRRAKTQDLTEEGPIWPAWIALRDVIAEPWYGYRGKWGADGASPRGPSAARRGGKGCGA